MDTNKAIAILYKAFSSGAAICTDTRKVNEGCIFFALKGENFNGNTFAAEAISKGAALAVIDEEQYATGSNLLLVENVLKCLQALATYHRNELKTKIIGITGSNGKTTTKELVAAVLNKKFKTHFTQGNLNNHIGVPLTLLQLTKEHEMAVIEMGANHQKEIEELASITQPDFGLITNIGKAHLEGFGGLEGVRKGKGELYDYLKHNNRLAFSNADNNTLREMLAERNLSAITYAFNNPKADCKGEMEGSEISWTYKEQQGKTESQLFGKYNYENILAAICIGSYFGISANLISEAIKTYTPSNNRSQVIKKENRTIIMDAYNANPSSMELAIANFAELQVENKAAIIGDMLEVGNSSVQEHENILSLLQKLTLNTYLVGPTFYSLKAKYPVFKYFHNVDELHTLLKEKTPTINHWLIKGSRGIRLEKVLEIL